ncbi:MAG: hypothetical protein ABIQ32_12755 [Sphingomicrobium sp.]
MSEQFGFDFNDSSAPVYAELPAGGWHDPEFSTEQYHALFARAAECVSSIAGVVGSMLRLGLDAAIEEHARMLECCPERDEPYSLWRTNFAPAKRSTDAFLRWVETTDGAAKTPAGLETKLRRDKGMTVAAVFVEHVGSVVVHVWPDCDGKPNVGVDYRPWRDTFFLASYRDQMPTVYAPERVFASAYCADKIAYSNDGVASVPTFTLHGREYVNDGGMSHGSYRECQGWSFCALADWKGPTYSYRTQVKAWDDGRTERADRRGLVVSVRGQLAVLDGAIRVYDDKAGGFTPPVLEEETEQLLDDREEEFVADEEVNV